MATWLPEFGHQCCDTQLYLETALRCYTQGDCSSFRPLGATYYHVLPLWLGLPPNAIILFNWALMAASVLLSILAARALWPKLRQAWSLSLLLLSGGAHYAFLIQDSKTALTDVPSTCLALIGLWALALGARSKGRAWMLLSGLSLAAASLIRVFYLYPSYLLLVVLGLGQWLSGIPSRPQFKALLLAFLLPVGFQYAYTYRHYGHVAFSEEDYNSTVATIHKTSAAWGYDTRWNPVEGMFYKDDSLLKNPAGGFYYAWVQGDWAGGFRLGLKRQQYYFGSFAGRTYLDRREDRVFMPWLLWVHGLLALLLLWALFYGEGGWIRLPIAAFAAAVWALGTALLPESRFIYVFYILLWTAGPFALMARLFGGEAEAAPAQLAPPAAPPLSPAQRERAPRRPAAAEPAANAWGLDEAPKRGPRRSKPGRRRTR